MIQLNLQTRENLNWRIGHRSGETKLGELVSVLHNLDDLTETPGAYVVLGICEDIGVRANFGNPGTRKAWEAFLDAFVNIQTATNDLYENTIIILGYIHVTPDQELTYKTPKKDLGAIVERIDKKVADLVERIVKAGKIPIIIGGGHNNALGNIKGSSQALDCSINTINIDAHTDLRISDYRHSGNGFTYAFQHPGGSLINKYVIFGVHKNYTPEYIFDFMDAKKEYIQYYLYDDMLNSQKQLANFYEALDAVSDTYFGIEIDCDSMAAFPSSAQTPSGFSIDIVRQFVQSLGRSQKSIYLHICEAAPTKQNKTLVGKTLTYLVTDFIRSHRAHNSLQ